MKITWIFVLGLLLSSCGGGGGGGSATQGATTSANASRVWGDLVDTVGTSSIVLTDSHEPPGTDDMLRLSPCTQVDKCLAITWTKYNSDGTPQDPATICIWKDSGTFKVGTGAVEYTDPITVTCEAGAPTILEDAGSDFKIPTFNIVMKTDPAVEPDWCSVYPMLSYC